MTLPTVVAVVPVYNHEMAVPAVVAALRAHGLPVILVDDGSDEACSRALAELARAAAQLKAIERLRKGLKR